MIQHQPLFERIVSEKGHEYFPGLSKRKSGDQLRAWFAAQDDPRLRALATEKDTEKLRAIYVQEVHFRPEIDAAHPYKGPVARSPSGAIGYLKALRHAYPQMRYVNFMDDILHPDEGWLEEFVPMYKREIGLPFVAQHRPGLLTERATSLLRDAGCYELHFGLESGNQEMRRKILKRGNITDEQIIEAFRLCKKYDIATGAYNMIGLPFETMSMALETIKLNALVAPNLVWNPIFTPYPRTDLHRVAAEAGLVAEEPDYETEVIVDNPGFHPRQVLFVRAYFKLFVDAYKVARRLPR